MALEIYIRKDIYGNLSIVLDNWAKYFIKNF